MDISLTKKQYRFVNATQTEVLYGGAAGGGKTYGQILDAFLYALKYPGSRQLILRRTFPELNKNIIRNIQAIYPRSVFSYSSTTHTGRFVNGSLIDFGYLATEADVFQYQGAEYDVIRFDELTHFTEFQYIYLISRLRGANAFPKSVKSSTNPGGIGHSWVKARFIDPAPADSEFEGFDANGRKTGTRIFIPSKVQENRFLMEKDPGYLVRLENLPEKERKALLLGEWDIFDGIRFTSFSRAVHVTEPFQVPAEWRRYIAMDYGLDGLAVLWVAIDRDRNIYVYRELFAKSVIIRDAARRILEETGEDEIYATLAPPDLRSRSQETGKSRADIFAENGVRFTFVSNDRAAGWSAIDELLAVDAEGRARLHIFSTCTELIRCLPMLQIDPKRPDDVMTEPHEITHIPDALRYFAVFWSRPAPSIEQQGPRVTWTQDMWEDFRGATPTERARLREMWGDPPRVWRK